MLKKKVGIHLNKEEAIICISAPQEHGTHTQSLRYTSLETLANKLQSALKNNNQYSCNVTLSEDQTHKKRLTLEKKWSHKKAHNFISNNIDKILKQDKNGVSFYINVFYTENTTQINLYYTSIKRINDIQILMQKMKINCKSILPIESRLIDSLPWHQRSRQCIFIMPGKKIYAYKDAALICNVTAMSKDSITEIERIFIKKKRVHIYAFHHNKNFDFFGENQIKNRKWHQLPRSLLLTNQNHWEAIVAYG